MENSSPFQPLHKNAALVIMLVSQRAAQIREMPKSLDQRVTDMASVTGALVAGCSSAPVTRRTTRQPARSARGSLIVNAHQRLLPQRCGSPPKLQPRARLGFSTRMLGCCSRARCRTAVLLALGC